MGQIVSSAAKPKRCNLNKLSQLGTPAAGEYILVSSDNSMNAAGQGNFDCYIEGNGRDAATALTLHPLADETPTSGSLNSATSGGVYDAIQEVVEQINGEATEEEETYITRHSSSAISYEDGSSLSIITYIAKYEVSSDNEYVANIFQGPNTAFKVAGVSYFDEDNNFISSEYNRNEYAGQTLIKVALTIPSNAKYAYVNGASDSESKYPRLFKVSYANGLVQALEGKVAKTDIVNNATTGGTDKVLSAEQGKIFAANNAYSLLGSKNSNSYTSGGITFTYDSASDSYHVKGTSTAHVSKKVIGDTSTIPSGFESGKSLLIKGMTENVFIRIVEYTDGSATLTTIIYNQSYYTVSAGITGLEMYLYVPKGTSNVDEYVKPEVLNTISNDELFEHFKADVLNGQNLLLLSKKSSETTHNGITYTYNLGTWTVSGTATSTSWVSVKVASTSGPSGFKAGTFMKVEYSGTNVALHIIQRGKDANILSSELVYSDSIISIDADTVGVEIRLRVASGTTVDETVTPIITKYLNNEELTKKVYDALQVDENEAYKRSILWCAKSYYTMTRANQFTYGERSALYYGDGTLNQVHCGGLAYLIVSGCPYFASRYVSSNSVNGSYIAGYGFDFEAYSLRLAQSGDEEEIAYIGSDNVNKTAEELKELMLFKTSYKQSVSCLRWGMIQYVQSGDTVDTSLMQVGDMIFYGNADDGEAKYIDGELITPVLFEGNRIQHVDTVIKIVDGTPYVISAGSAPISIGAFSKGGFDYVCVGRVPLFNNE